MEIITKNGTLKQDDYIILFKNKNDKNRWAHILKTMSGLYIGDSENLIKIVEEIRENDLSYMKYSEEKLNKLVGINKKIRDLKYQKKIIEKGG